MAQVKITYHNSDGELETAIRGLKELIEQDKKANDLKSLTYHTMALNESKRTLEELKKQM